MTAACAAGADISINATTSKQNSSIYTSVVDTDAANNNSNNDLENGAFDVGTNFNLLVANDGNPGLITFKYNATDNASVTGTIATNEVGASRYLATPLWKLSNAARTLVKNKTFAISATRGLAYSAMGPNTNPGPASIAAG